ncbi:MAG: DUF1684 domain-containing protein [Acidobacteria bacterium]|nr:DUF1684 domain-containing protein [Acidobacteriota bacterium]MDW7983521.1 DUF1684 domain-containing protein [Acidobacteriota bacterium]
MQFPGSWTLGLSRYPACLTWATAFILIACGTVIGTPGRAAGPSPEAEVLHWWQLRLRRFQSAPTSPVAVHRVFYLADGQALYATAYDSKAVDWGVASAAPAGAVFSVAFRDRKFTTVWKPGLAPVQSLQSWDPETLRADWRDVASPYTWVEGTLRWGDWPLHLSYHPPYGRVIVFRPLTERPVNFPSFDLFPYDGRFRFRARLIPAERRQTVWIETSRGLQTPLPDVGWLEFDWQGKPYRLRAFIESGDDLSVLFIIFRDATTGKTTYPIGRYVEAERQPDGSYVLDFNKAYVPLCAYSDAYNCPIPPKENTRGWAVLAGERYMGKGVSGGRGSRGPGPRKGPRSQTSLRSMESSRPKDLTLQV